MRSVDTLLNSVDMGFVTLNESGAVQACNLWMLQHARLKPDWIGQPLPDAFDGVIDPHLLSAVKEALSKGCSSRLSHAFHPMPLPLYPVRGQDSERLQQAVNVIAYEVDGQRHCALQVRDVTEALRREQLLKQQAQQLARDVAELRQAQAEVARQSLRFSEMAKLAPVGLFETDMAGRLTYANDRCVEMLGLNPERDLGKPWTQTLSPELAVPLFTRWRCAADSDTRVVEEFSLAGARHEERRYRLEAGPIRDLLQTPIGIISTLMDVTDLYHRAERHEFRANHDVLTGLSNRHRFEKRVTAALAGAEALNQSMALVYLDLDGFKPVNDQFGHAAGDIVLRTIAKRIRGTLRSDDTVARLGGDEFGILFTEAPEAKQLQALLDKLTQAIAKPVSLGDVEVRIGCSYGVAIFPGDGVDVQSLMQHADHAMYIHKAARKHDLEASPAPAPLGD